MKIGIIGAGAIGSGLAKRLGPAGHEIILSYSHDRTKLDLLAASLGAWSCDPAEAAGMSDVVVLAAPWAAVPDAIARCGSLDGRILWDCTNALKCDFSGLEIGTTTSGGEEVARLAGGARVVKAIPPSAEVLHSEHALIAGRPASVFIASDDADAKSVVSGLLSKVPALVIDTGPLIASRYIEPAMMVIVQLAFSQRMGTRITLDLRRELAT